MLDEAKDALTKAPAPALYLPRRSPAKEQLGGNRDKDSCFRAGSTLCPGCMESVAFQNIGRVTDNGVKTIFTIGTSCAEVSTLAFPNVVAWGRGDDSPDDFGKSFSILHNVFESAPTLAEATRDGRRAHGLRRSRASRADHQHRR